VWLSQALPALPGPRFVTTLLAVRARGLVGAVEPLEFATPVFLFLSSSTSLLWCQAPNSARSSQEQQGGCQQS